MDSTFLQLDACWVPTETSWRQLRGLIRWSLVIWSTWSTFLIGDLIYLIRWSLVIWSTWSAEIRSDQIWSDQQMPRSILSDTPSHQCPLFMLVKCKILVGQGLVLKGSSSKKFTFLHTSHKKWDGVIPHWGMGHLAQKAQNTLKTGGVLSIIFKEYLPSMPF